MKKALAILAVVALCSTFAFAASATNNFTVNVSCPGQSLSALDFTTDPIPLTAPASATVSAASWTVTNWGATGTFTAVLTGPTTAIPAFATYTVAAGAWTGATASGTLVTFDSQACNTSATYTIPAGTFAVTAAAIAGPILVDYTMTVTYN